MTKKGIVTHGIVKRGINCDILNSIRSCPHCQGIISEEFLVRIRAYEWQIELACPNRSVAESLFDLLEAQTLTINCITV